MFVCMAFGACSAKDGGNAGGNIVASGTPEQIAKDNNSVTGHYLRERLQ